LPQNKVDKVLGENFPFWANYFRSHCVGDKGKHVRLKEMLKERQRNIAYIRRQR